MMNYSTKTLWDTALKKIRDLGVDPEDVADRVIETAMALKRTDPKFEPDKVDFKQIENAMSEWVKSNLRKN